MDSIIICIIAISVFLILTTIIGFSTGDSGKSFDVVKFVIHSIIFFMMVIVWITSIHDLQEISNATKLLPLVILYILGFTLLTNFTIGLTRALINQSNRKLVVIHKYSKLVMTISVLTSIIHFISSN